MIVVAAMVAVSICGCADSKTFKKSDGTEFVAKPYGWMDREDKIEGVEYDICGGNIVLSVVLGETIIAPVLLTGLELWEPVMYNEPKQE